MAGVRGGRERGSVFRRRRVRGVVFLSLSFGKYHNEDTHTKWRNLEQELDKTSFPAF